MQICIPTSITDELRGIKKDIRKIKGLVQELFEMMKAVYEFEDA